MSEKIEVAYGLAVYRPEQVCQIIPGKRSAYGWFLIIGGWALSVGVGTALVTLLALGILPLKPFFIAFVIALMVMKR